MAYHILYDGWDLVYKYIQGQRWALFLIDWQSNSFDQSYP